MWLERIEDVWGRPHVLCHSPMSDGYCPWGDERWIGPHTHPLYEDVDVMA